MNDLVMLPILAALDLPIIILIVIGGIILLLGIIIAVYFLLFKKKKKTVVNNEDWFLALGSKENVKEIRGVGSRLTIKLVDKEKLNRERLKELGVTSVLAMSDKITLVIEGQAEKLATILNQNL